MSDRILIKDLKLRTIIGINDAERRNRQDVLINIVLFADTRRAGRSDDIEDAVNYRTLTKRIIRLVEESCFFLVEKLAAEIGHICLSDSRIERVRVRVEKPGALRFARSVGVEIERTRGDLPQTTAVFVSLGSNIDPERNLREAVRLLAERTDVVAVSPVYQTDPIGNTDQPSSLNAAVEIRTHLSAIELKTRVLDRVEEKLHRVRTADKNGPRTIDLDIALFGDLVSELDGQRIPEPDMLRYAHVIRPLADLAPGIKHPQTGQLLSELADSIGNVGLDAREDLHLRTLLPTG